MTDVRAETLSALPDLSDDAIRPVGSRRIDEWPAGLQGLVPRPASMPLVVAPADSKAVAALLRWATGAGRRVQALGLGSNVIGAIDPTVDVVISMERMTGIEIHAHDLTVTVGAGCDGRKLEERLEANGLTLGHYPQSLHVSTVGGWIATRATGTYSAYHGGIDRLLVGAEYVEPSGEIVHVAPRPRVSGGLDLLGLLCGSEGSLGIVTNATLAVSRKLDERRICGASTTLAAGLEAQRQLSQAGLPLGLVRLYNAPETVHVAQPGTVSEGECLLVVTTLGPDSVAEAAAQSAAALIRTLGLRLLPEHAADPWFANRYAAPGFMADRNQDPCRIFDTVESALPWSTAAACADDLQNALGELSCPLYQHFSHVYRTGVCLYAILFIAGDDAEQTRSRWEAAWSLVLNVVHQHGGTLAHHHGIGAQRAERYQRTPEARLHRRLAHVCDPAGVLAAPMIDIEVTERVLAHGIGVGNA